MVGMKTRVILAEDHTLMRAGLRVLLSKQAGIEIVGETGTGRETVEMARKLAPDVVIMDVCMPDLNGIEATERILTICRNAKVVALSMHSSRQFVAGMLRAGASGYVLKECAFDELVRAIRCAMSGQVYLSPKIARTVMQDYVQFLDGKAPSSEQPELTGRQREILQLLAEGASPREIANRLNLSLKTVETHRQNVMQRLGLKNIADLTKYAIKHGVTSLES